VAGQSAPTNSDRSHVPGSRLHSSGPAETHQPRTHRGPSISPPGSVVTAGDACWKLQRSELPEYHCSATADIGIDLVLRVITTIRVSVLEGAYHRAMALYGRMEIIELQPSRRTDRSVQRSLSHDRFRNRHESVRLMRSSGQGPTSRTAISSCELIQLRFQFCAKKKKNPNFHYFVCSYSAPDPCTVGMSPRSFGATYSYKIHQPPAPLYPSKIALRTRKMQNAKQNKIKTYTNI
jgi:hypothetical protein